MNSTDTQAKERPGIPAWVNLEALVEATGGKADLDYRTECGPTGRLLVNALARWVKSMLDVAQHPDLSVIDDEDVHDAITDALGFEAIDYVTSFVHEMYESLVKALRGEERFDSWKDGYAGPREHVWETRDPLGWFDMRLAGEGWAIGLARQVRALGGEVIWAIEDREERLPVPQDGPDLDQLTAATRLCESYGLVVTTPEFLRDDPTE